MRKKRFSAEQIVMLLRQIEVSMAQVNLPQKSAGLQRYHNKGIIAGAGNSVAGRSIRRNG